MVGRTNPYDIEPVRGYPTGLQIYRIPASSVWQVRLFVGRKYLRKSTKFESKVEAIKFAKRFYDEVRLAERLDFDIHRDSFAACSNYLMKRQKALVGRGERDDRLISEDRKKLAKDILPYFGVMAVADIRTETLEDYLDHISRDRKLSPSTLSKHVVVIRKVLNEARKRGYLKALPVLPTIKRKDNPRPYFTDVEYKTLRDTAKRLASENVTVRYVPLTSEVYDFIIFATNTFVRPSDWYLLQHKHVEVVKEKGTKYLLLTPPQPKTVRRQSASMEVAVVVYERLRERHEKLGLAGDDDYLFFPEFKNRAYALATIRRQFEHVLEEARLKHDKRGRARTLYSLRHTALMFRLLKGDKIDIFMLARNALTSVNQLERFYLSHAESRMKIHELQSFGKRTA
jgi:hypothetical protein